VTLIVDAAPLVALADHRDPLQSVVREVLVNEPGRLIVPAPITAEVDVMLGRRLGWPAQVAFVGDPAAGRFVVESLEVGDYIAVAELEARYVHLGLGLAAAAIAVLAARFGTIRVLTFNDRIFREIRPLQGGAFDLQPGQRPPLRMGVPSAR
jgi:predicted nucleic acid-binding protein